MTTLSDYPELMLITEVSQVLRLNRYTIGRYCREGKLQYVQFHPGNRHNIYRIFRYSVEEFLQKAESTPPPKIVKVAKPKVVDIDALYKNKYKRSNTP